MGYYSGWGRSPEDVQRVNGIKTDFDVAVRRYESTKPLRGKRSVMDVRPLGQRDRSFERIVKVSDTEYYLSCNSHTYYDNVKLEQRESEYALTRKVRAITLKREGEIETIIIHRPQYGMPGNSTIYFYEFNLPLGMSMMNHKATKYVRVLNKDNQYNYYTLDKGDITFYRAKGTSFWTPLEIHREVTRKLDRIKTKEIRQTLKGFIEYTKIMMPLIEPKQRYVSLLGGHWRQELAQKDSEEIPECWLDLVANYAHKVLRYDRNTKQYIASTKSAINAIYRDAYMVEKPLITEAVPLGELSHDAYKGWV